MKRTLRRQIWELLREQARPMRAREIQTHFPDRSRGAVWEAIERLTERGCVLSSGSSWQRVHTATNRVPIDLRGKTAGTAIALAKGRESTRQFARYVSGRLPPPAIALEAHWRVNESRGDAL